MLTNLRDWLGYAMTHKAAIAAALTILSIVLAHFGIVLPVLPHDLVTAILVVLTGFFGVNSDEAAFIDGYLEGHGDGIDASVSPGGTA